MDIPEGGMEKILAIEKSITGMIDLHRLVKELKEMEIQQQSSIEDLQGHVNQYRTFLENIPLRFFIKDKDLSYSYCNQPYADDLKKQPGEIIGRTDRDFFPYDLAEKFMGDDKKVLEAGELFNIEDPYIVDGQEFIVHMVKAPLRDEKGMITGLIGIFWDITPEKNREEEAIRTRAQIEDLLSNRTDELEKTIQRLQQETSERRQVEERLRQAEDEREETSRKLQQETSERNQAEERLRQTEEIRQSLEKALQKSEERHKWLVEKAPVAIGVIQKGLFKFINPGIIGIFGYSEEELASQPVLEFIHTDDREMDKLLFKEVNEGELPQVFFFKILHKNGTIRWVEDRVDLIHWEGSPATINFFTDITLRKQAEDELLNSLQPFRNLIEKAQKVITTE
ncbi:MAG: PAS domain S-box protein [Deltaproteobacteria bacterium]|nr:PAS domain S-box protein [Deltaproteobacteria bacterium]